jgi:hypothetical protein
MGAAINRLRIGERLVWAVRSNNLTHWGTRVPPWYDDISSNPIITISKVNHFCKSLSTKVHCINYKIGSLGTQPQVVKPTSFFPRVDASLRVLRVPPPLKPVAMI